jgi:hypothetical protein
MDLYLHSPNAFMVCTGTVFTFELQTIQLVACCYNDCAISALFDVDGVPKLLHRRFDFPSVT